MCIGSNYLCTVKIEDRVIHYKKLSELRSYLQNALKSTLSLCFSPHFIHVLFNLPLCIMLATLIYSQILASVLSQT